MLVNVMVMEVIANNSLGTTRILFLETFMLLGTSCNKQAYIRRKRG